DKGYHKLINVVRLDKTVKKVKNADPKGNKTPAEQKVPAIDGDTWQSDDSDYDDSDVFVPAYVDLTTEKGEVVRMVSDTIGHEVGHALGQPHILGLKREKKYQMDAEGVNDVESAGRTFEEKANIMGFGSQVTTINSLPWYKRLYRHTGTNHKDW